MTDDINWWDKPRSVDEQIQRCVYNARASRMSGWPRNEAYWNDMAERLRRRASKEQSCG